MKDTETVLDRRVHLEERLILDIPQVPRLCDELKLSKQRINVGDCELYCEQEGRGIPIVLLHGGPGATHHYFHPFFSQAAGFATVIYYDQRGCGLSDCEKGEGYSVAQAVDDLEHLRKALNVEKWIVLGHSYGGLLAQCYVVKYPESVAGLVLVGSSLAMPARLKPTRQYAYLSPEEIKRIREIHRNGTLSSEQKVYNAFLNGDWKRQNFYRPSKERIARIALYEWKHAPGFNGIMSSEARKIDLQGAFEGCPIPTVIIEGKWDLTWNTDKPKVLQGNHPRAKLVMFERSAHSPFEDEPDKFFQVLGDFVRGLREVPKGDVAAWRERLVGWRKKKESSPLYVLRTTGWGRRSNEKIARLYSPEWLEQVDDPGLLLKTGLALYDVKKYEEALRVLERAAERARRFKGFLAVCLIWRGHVLELLSRRKEAISVYQKVVDLNVSGRMSQDQFGLSYSPSSYAAERIKKPFTRLENLQAR